MSRHLPEGKDRIDEYGRWPTVWPAPDGGDGAEWWPYRLLGWLRTLAWAVVFLVGVPAGLWWAFGDPRRRVGSGSGLWEWADQPGSRLSGDMLLDVVVWVVWLGWAALALLLVGELVAAVTRLRLPVPHAPRHLRRLVFGLAGTTVVTVASTARTAPAVVVPAEATPVPAATVSALPPGAGPATIQVAAVRYRYVVRRHDTLSKIAREWLGDERRWPEICRLNRHRHFPRVGGTLRDCDLIYPGWDLKLPADATPPSGAIRQPPEPRPHGPSVAPPPGTPVPDDDDGVAEAPHNPTTTVPSVGATTAPAAVPAATPAPTTAGRVGASPPVTASPGTPPPPADTETGAAPCADHDGVRLPGGSFVPWALAAAIAAATAMAWLHRRRRFTPAGDAEPGQLPAPVVELHRQVARNPDLPTPADPAERATAAPALPLLQSGGIGLVGDGAHAAARAALVSYLASGGPHDPDRRGEVIIDRSTLTILLGADAAGLAPWPRLHVVDNLDHALSILDVRLLHRARVLDEHSLTDLNSLYEHAPDEEALPPILLITEPPPPAAQMRARVTFGLGADLGVTALLLGPWPPGSTITISTDGHIRLVSGPAVEGFDQRVGVLDTADAAAILTTLREAHTGQPPAHTLTTATAPRPPAPAPDAETDREPAQRPPHPPAAVSDRQPGTKVRLRVLGTPTIDNITLPGRPLRSKAAELAVYLACHPDGADTATIAEHLVPDARLRAAKQQVHTNASNLRHVLGRAGGPRPGGYVLKHGPNARYRLDPASIDVDLWQLHDLLQRARLASLPGRADLLRQACDLYRAPLANGCDYDWVEPHREKARLWGIEAHLLYAEDLLKTDPELPPVVRTPRVWGQRS